MRSNPLNFNKTILIDIKKIIEQIDINYRKALQNLFESKFSQSKINFKEVIDDLIEFIEDNKDPYEDNYLKGKKECFDKIKQNYKKYNEGILEIYENNYFKIIRKYKEKLDDLINKIIPDFEPPNINSFSSKIKILNLSYNSNESSINNESSNSNDNNLSHQISSYIDKQNYKPQIFENISQKIENKYFCTVCHEKEAITLCDECNQLYCQICEKSEDKNTNKCGHYLDKIANIKESNKIGKILFLNSLNNYIKRIILKSDYLLKNENQDIKSNKDNSNSSKDKKITLFEYPNLNIKDDLTEKKYFECINYILENNLGVQNLDIKNFNNSEIDNRLISILKRISMECKQDQINSISTLDISRNIYEEDDDDDFPQQVEDESLVKQ